MTEQKLEQTQEMGEDFNWVSGRDAIKSKIRLRVQVFKGEVPFYFDYGLSDYIFRYKPILVLSEVKLALATLGIVTDVQFQEGRVFVLDLNLVI